MRLGPLAVPVLVVALITALAACQPQAAASNAGFERSAAGLDQQVLTIETAGEVAHGTVRRHRFIVEIARTPQQKQIGLMNRRSLGPDRGMIFPFPEPRPASFWMKDTLIPLDIVFIRADGRIAAIAERAEPLSLAAINSHEPVAAVLEIAGGRSAELGIGPGDRVVWGQ